MKTNLPAGVLLSLALSLSGLTTNAQEGASKAKTNAAPTIVKSAPVDFHACELPPAKLILAIDLSVAEDGTPRDVKIGQSSGVPCLDAAAINAVRTYVFRPGMKDGKAVDSPVHLSMNLGGVGEKTPVPDEVPSVTGELTKAGTPVYKSANSIKPPKPIELPPVDTTAGLSGHLQATVSFVLNEKGKPENPRVDRSNDLRFNNAALEAVRQYRFQPATFKGKPVAVKMAVEVTFDR